MAEQINPIVSFEAAKKLAEVGYTGQWPQMVYQGEAHPTLAYWFSIGSTKQDERPRWYLAAPTHLQAFQFLEQEKGYSWSYNEFDLWNVMDNNGVWVAQGVFDPDSLILAICKHTEATNG